MLTLRFIGILLMPEPIFYTTTVTRKVIIASNMLEVRFAKPAGFIFKPGQFIQVHIPEGLGRIILRSYSLVSHPSSDYLALCIKLIAGGKGSSFFSSLAEGAEITFRGPEGRFIIMPEHSPVKVFVATGAGIAPILSMLEDEVLKSTNERVHLLFGVRHDDEVCYTERFESFKAVCSNWTYAITLSQPSEHWKGQRGRVTEHISSLPFAGDWYICGSLPMVKDVRALLTQAGMPNKKIHFEIF